jgi:uncharacterized protein YuzE
MTTVDYSRAGDAAYVKLARRRIVRTEEIDDNRSVDYDKAGNVIGVEFLGVSEGVDLDDLPLQPGVVERIDAALAKKIPGLRVYA